MPTAETPVLDDSIANLVEKVSQRLLVLTDGEHPAYVGSELPAVDRVLSRIQNEGLAPGPVFCEWGSGLGSASGAAAESVEWPPSMALGPMASRSNGNWSLPHVRSQAT